MMDLVASITQHQTSRKVIPGSHDITHLVIVSGVSCSGKSTIIQKMLRGSQDELCATLKMVKPYSNYRLMHAFELASCSTMPGPLVLLHYDTYFQQVPEHLARLSRLITWAKKTTILTLCPPRETLLHRNRSRMITELQTLCLSPAQYRRKFVRRFKYLLDGRRSYRQTAFTTSIIDSWQQFLDGFDIGTHVVYQNDDQNVYCEGPGVRISRDIQLMNTR